MHLYSNNLSTIAIISSFSMSELFPACFSCSNDLNLSHSSLGSDDKNVVEIPEAMIAGDLGDFISVRSQRDLSLGPFTSKYISFAKS